MAAVKRALALAGGFSRTVHFHLFRLNAALLNGLEAHALDGLLCNKAVTACCFQVCASKNVNAEVEWGLWCEECTARTRQCLEVFCETIVEQDECLTEADHATVRAVLAAWGEWISADAYTRIEYLGVAVGLRAMEDYQYLFHCGAPDKIRLAPGTGAYEYLKAAMLQAVAAGRILKDYDVLFVIDAGKSLWGVWADVAFALGKKVLFCSLNTLQSLPPRHYEALSPVLHDAVVPFRLRYSTFPGLERLRRRFADQRAFQELRRKGQAILEGRFPECLPEQEVRAALGVPEGKKIACIFTHLCWDNAMVFGSPLVNTFEEWLDLTFATARQVPDVHWVVKLHPGELEKHRGVNHPEINTKAFVEKCLADAPANISVLPDTSLSTRELASVIVAGITMCGTVNYELPALGVPCLNVVKGVHSGLGFTRDCADLGAYVEALRTIGDMRLAEGERELAQAYTGLLYDPELAINVAHLLCGPEWSELKTAELPRFVEENTLRFQELINRKFV